MVYTTEVFDRWFAGLRDAMDVAGCDCVNLRVHVPGVATEVAREQIRRLGDDVVPQFRT